MVKPSKQLQCENRNCGRVVKQLRGYGFEEEGRLKLCDACYWYARTHAKLRSRELVRMAEERARKVSRVCENPNCGEVVKGLKRIDLEGQGYLRLCVTCYDYGRKHKQLRSVEMVKKVQEMKGRRMPKGKHCHNPNCRTTQLYEGRYGKDNGEFYCHTCAIYRNNHGEDRPKAVVEARQRVVATGGGFGECENSNCGKLVKKLTGFEFEQEGWLKLCNACYKYARRHSIFKSKESIEEAENKKKRRLNRGECCFNKNCQTTHLDRGMYSKYNGEFYCRDCGKYVDSHNGEERPKTLVKASKRCLKQCENPNCDTKTTYLYKAGVDGVGRPRLCKQCYEYARRTGHFRTVEMIGRVQMKKRKKAGEVKCHNANCKVTVLGMGGYAKCNGEYYCAACCAYVDKHGGEERPKKLVEELNLRRNRYMWQLNHPDIPED